MGAGVGRNGMVQKAGVQGNTLRGQVQGLFGGKLIGSNGLRLRIPPVPRAKVLPWPEPGRRNWSLGRRKLLAGEGLGQPHRSANGCARGGTVGGGASAAA